MKITDTICAGRDIKSVFSTALQYIEHDAAYVVKINEGNARTLAQNKRMWAMLNDIANQVWWHEAKLSAVEWKDVFSASIKKQRLIPGLDGELVVVGASTSKETKKFLSEMIELIYSFGADLNVFWSDPAEKQLMNYPEAQRV